jgi:hypothetical protein
LHFVCYNSLQPTTSPQQYKRTIHLGLHMLTYFSGTGSSIG